MDHRNDSSDSQTEAYWDTEWDYQLSEFSKEFPSQPSVCKIRRSMHFERARMLHSTYDGRITDPSTGWYAKESEITRIHNVHFHNRDTEPYYVFRLDGTLDQVIEPAGSDVPFYGKSLKISLFKNLGSRDKSLAEELGIKKKDKLVDKFVRGFLELTDSSFVSTEGVTRDSIYIPELQLIVSKNPKACDLITEGHSAQVLRNWITSKKRLLNVDLFYKLIAFVNEDSSVTELFSSSDGKLFERVFIIRTPVVPAGEIYCRVNSYSSEGKKYRNKPMTVKLSELQNEGAVLLDHTLVLGLETKAIKEWCRIRRFENRYATLADIECDDFLEEKQNTVKSKDVIRELKAEIRDLKEQLERKEEIINGYKRHAQAALNTIGKPQGKSMSDVCKHLEHITEGLDAPRKKRSFREKLSDFADGAHAFFKGVDGVYKAVVAAVGLFTLVAGLIIKFKQK